MNSFLGTYDLLVLPKKSIGISNNEPGALCVVWNEKKKIQFLSSRILPERATVSTFVCKAVCTSLASSSQNLAEKKCRQLYPPLQGSYVHVFKYKILIRNWEQKGLLQTVAHNKMKSSSVYLRRKFRFKKQPNCSSSVFFLLL